MKTLKRCMATNWTISAKNAHCVFLNAKGPGFVAIQRECR